MLGVFYCSEKGQAIPWNDPAGVYHGRHRQAVGEAGTKCCPHERGYHGHGTSWEQIPDTRDQTIYIFCTYRSPFQGGCGIFLFDIFLFISQTEHKKAHCFYDERTGYAAGALFLRFQMRASAAVQEPCAAPLVLKTD